MTIQRKNPRAGKRWALLGTSLIALSLIGGAVVSAQAPAPSLTGSNFEIDTDANLKLDTSAPNQDWATVAQGTTAGTEIRKADTASGGGDESFGNGTKEDTAVPSVVDGGIPPNKSDLKFFGIYQEGNTSSGFLNLFWSRVQEPSGTTNMDFEFNQSSQLSSNGVTPVRTANDLLVQYDLAQGGTNPQLFISKWVTTGPKALCEAANSTPCWGVRVAVGTANSAGSINSSIIPIAQSDGLGEHSPRTFGEAQLRLASIFPDPTICQTFGFAYLKSRSSDSFTSALKDFVPPISVNITNCGSVKIVKKDDAGAALAGAGFTLYKNNAPLAAPRGAEDTITTLTCTTPASGECTIINVLQGNYWVVETTVPPGHSAAPDTAITVAAGAQVTVNLTDPRLRGAIRVVKTAKHADTSGATSPNLVATFTVTQGASTIGTITTDATGVGCLANLLFGSYTVTETTVPAGYAAPAAQTAAVSTSGSCPAGSVTKTFDNTPLTDLTVSVSSQVTGGTASTITCTGLTPTPADSTPNAFDDISETVEDLAPGTYTCTIVIDP